MPLNNKSFRRWICLLLAAHLFAGGWVLWHRREPHGPQWTFRDGLRVRFELLTLGGQGGPRWNGSIRRELVETWPSVFAPFLGPPTRYLDSSETNHPHLWLHFWFPNSRSGNPEGWTLNCLDGDHAEFPAETHQRAVKFMGGGGSLPEVLLPIRLPVATWRTRQLRFALTSGSERWEFSIPNPRFRESFATWTPTALPATQHVGRFEVRLTGWQRGESGVPAAWKSTAEVWLGNTNVTDWFTLKQTCLDPTGNTHSNRLPASEALWKVQIRAEPNLRFPYPAEDRIDLGTLAGPANGTWYPLTLNPEWVEKGVTHAWVTGPGQFEFRNGTNLSAKPHWGRSGGGRRMVSEEDFEVVDTSWKALVWIHLRDQPGRSSFLQKITDPAARPRVQVRQARMPLVELPGEVQCELNTPRRMLLSFELNSSEDAEWTLVTAQPVEATFCVTAPEPSRH